jgi:hypothetical protein
VQRHRRLAGARPAGHDRHAGCGRADRLVLLALDGGDDVAHAVPGRLGQAGQQRAVADHPHVRRCRVGVEQVVLDADDPLAAGLDHPAAYHAERLGRGGPVEGGGRGRPPVDHQGLRVRVADAHPAHVVGGPAVEVEPAEDQALVLGVEGTPAPGRVVDHGVPLDQGAERADAGQLVALLLGARGVPA